MDCEWFLVFQCQNNQLGKETDGKRLQNSENKDLSFDSNAAKLAVAEWCYHLFRFSKR